MNPPIPLVTKNDLSYSSDATTGSTLSSSASTTAVQPTDANWLNWTRNDSAFDAISSGTPWTLETFMQNNSAVNGFVELFNSSTNQSIVTNTHASSPTLPVKTSFASTATNFTNLNNVAARIRVTSGTTYLYKAGLWLKLDTLRELELYHLLALGGTSSTVGSTNSDTGRFLFESAKWSNTTAFFAAQVSGTGSALSLQNSGTLDAGTGSATTVSASTIAPPPTATLYRVGPITLTDTSRYFIRQTITSGTGVYRGAYLVTRSAVPTDASAPTVTYTNNTDVTLSTASPIGTTLTPTIDDQGSPITDCVMSSATPLPAGLTLDPTTCAITGQPTSASIYRIYEIIVTNANGSRSVFIGFRVAPLISYVGATGTSIDLDASFTVSPTTLTAVNPLCSVTPALPAGMSLNATTCVLTGTPANPINTTFTVTVFDQATSVSASNTVTLVATLPSGRTPFSIVVPIQLNAIGLQSSTSALDFANATKTSFDPADYVSNTNTFYFEIVASNANSTTAYAVDLLNEANTVVSSISVAANTSALRRFRSTPWNPGAASTFYRVRLAATASASQLRVASAKILVEQTNAVRTKLYIPLVMVNDGAYATDATTGSLVSSTTSSTATQGTGNWLTWTRNDSAFDTIGSGTPWTLETFMQNNAAVNGFVDLFNTTTGQLITTNTHASSPTTPVTTSFASTATNFTNLNKIGARIRVTSGYTSYLYKAGLWLKLNTLKKVELYHLLAMGGSNSTTTSIDTGRFLFENSKWTNTQFVMTTEASGAGSTITLRDSGTLDTGTASSTAVASSAIAPATSSAIISSGPFTLTDTSRYFVTNTITSGTGVYKGMFLVSRTVPPTDPQAPIVTFPTPSDVTLYAGTNIETTLTPTVNDQGSPVTSCSISSATPLPAGLSINSTTCAITGTPTVAAGYAIYDVIVTSALGTRTFSIGFRVNPGISYATSAGKSINLGTSFSVTPSTFVVSNAGQVTCAISPALPAELSFNGTTCAITGTPRNGINTTYTVSLLDQVLNYTSTTTVTLQASVAAGVVAPNIVVPIQLNAIGLQSSTSALDYYSATRTSFDPADYMAQANTFYFEIVASNANTQTAYTVDLLNDVGTTISSISVPASTTALTRLRSTSWTPDTAATYYRVRLAATASASQLKVASAKILVEQTNALQTKIYIPLVLANDGVYASDAQFGSILSSTTSTSATQVGLSWIRNDSAFDTIASGSPWTLEAFMSNQSFSRTSSADLYNSTTGLLITTASVVGQAVAPGISTFASTTTNFTDLNKVNVRIRTSNALYANYLFKAGLWLKLSSVKKLETYHLLAQGISNSTAGTINYDTGRFLFESSKWTHTTPFLGIEGSGTGSTLVAQSSATDSGTGSNVTYSSLVPAASLTSYRMGPLVLTNASRYFLKHTITSGTGVYQGAFMVMRTNAPTNSNAPTVVYASDGHFTISRSVAQNITPTVTNNGYSVTSCTVSPALPTGLTLNNTTCVISGTASATSARAIYEITATNSQGSRSVFIEMTVQ